MRDCPVFIICKMYNPDNAMDVFTVFKEFGLPLGILIAGIYYTYKYFREETIKKDAIIKDKDEQIHDMNDKYAGLVEKSIKSNYDIINMVTNKIKEHDDSSGEEG